MESKKSDSGTPKAFAWQESKVGLAVISVLDLFISYIFASLAVDTGSLLQYAIAVVFMALAVGHFVKLIRKIARRGHE